MKYYIVAENQIVTTVTDLDPNPPCLNQRVAYVPKASVAGSEICMTDENGILYFILQESFNLKNGIQWMTGIVTRIGQGSADQAKAAITQYLNCNE